jgi:hypothetical protein
MLPPHAPAVLLATEGYREIFPWVQWPVTARNAARVLQETARAERQCPAQSRFVWWYRAEAFRLLGQHEAARAARRKVPARPVWE